MKFLLTIYTYKISVERMVKYNSSLYKLVNEIGKTSGR